MKSFITFVTEELNASSLNKANMLINRYVKKKAKRNFFGAGLEKFKNSGGKGVGMRFYSTKGQYSFRINWRSASTASMFNIDSVDFWDGKKSDPSVRLTFDDNPSLVKVLPLVVKMVDEKMRAFRPGDAVSSEAEGFTLKEDLEDCLGDELLLEDLEFMLEGVNPDPFTGVVELLTQPGFKKGRVWAMYKSTGGKIFEALEARFPDLIVKQGVKYVWNSSSPKDVKRVNDARDEVLDEIGASSGKASKGPTGESYVIDDETKNIENNRERIAYEKQIEDLENLTKMTVAGTANAMFVAGKGGCLSGDTEITLV